MANGRAASIDRHCVHSYRKSLEKAFCRILGRTLLADWTLSLYEGSQVNLFLTHASVLHTLKSCVNRSHRTLHSNEQYNGAQTGSLLDAQGHLAANLIHRWTLACTIQGTHLHLQSRHSDAF